MRQKGKQVAIVGGGATGVLLALQLLRDRRRIARVVIIERQAPPALGVAYRTTSPSHVLNTRADRMDALNELPGEFVSWLHSHAIDPAPSGSLEEAFVPRHLYGAYLRAMLWRESRESDVFFEIVHDEAIGLDEQDDSVSLDLRSGARLAGFDAVVLAPGHFPPADTSPPYYYGNPWHEDALASLSPDATVLLLGTGLTMIDVVCSLLDRRHRGPVHAVSRHGLLPLVHTAHRMPPPPFVLPATRSVRTLVRAVRAAAAEPGDDEQAWQGIMERLRETAPEIWLRLPIDEQRRFLRHVRPWWEIHRHRMAPAVAERIDGALRSGMLHVRAGRMSDLQNGPRTAVARLRFRGSERHVKLRVACVLNCKGPLAYARANDPLLEAMFRDRRAQCDAHGLGLKVDPDCRMLDGDDRPSSRIYAAGPATRGTFWEITSLPEIRAQTARIALALSGRRPIGMEAGALRKRRLPGWLRPAGDHLPAHRA